MCAGNTGGFKLSRLLRLTSAVVLSVGMLLVAAGPTLASSGGGGTPVTYYYVDNVYGHYDGYYDGSTGYGCVGPCTAAFTEGESFSNSWGANIQFTKGPIQAQFSWNITLTSSRSFTASFYVPSGSTGIVRYQDWFHVTQLHIHTVSCGWVCGTGNYGTAWAAQWYQRAFYIAY